MEVIYHGSGRSTVQLPAAANLASSSAAGGSSAPRTPHDDERVQGLSHLKQRLDRLQQNIRGMEAAPSGTSPHRPSPSSHKTKNFTPGASYDVPSNRLLAASRLQQQQQPPRRGGDELLAAVARITSAAGASSSGRGQHHAALPARADHSATSPMARGDEAEAAACRRLVTDISMMRRKAAARSQVLTAIQQQQDTINQLLVSTFDGQAAGRSSGRPRSARAGGAAAQPAPLQRPRSAAATGLLAQAAGRRPASGLSRTAQLLYDYQADNDDDDDDDGDVVFFDEAVDEWLTPQQQRQQQGRASAVVSHAATAAAVASTGTQSDHHAAALAQDGLRAGQLAAAYQSALQGTAAAAGSSGVEHASPASAAATAASPAASLGSRVAAAAASLQASHADRMFNRLQRLRTTPMHNPSAGLPLEDQEQIGRETMERCTAAVANKAAGEPCCICLDAMALDQPVRMLTCSHRMHGPCLARWLRGKRVCVCPLCQQESGP